jgi:bifunctional DNA-binding transcriptional regulator/antitoxin component of YhaV-PrlF toxin-antitoxin module
MPNSLHVSGEVAMSSPEPLPVRRPTRGSKTGRVWAVADEITKQAGRPATRAEVISQILAEGGNAGTASTQYNDWKKQFPQLAEQTQSPQAPLGPIPLQIKEAGRIVLTAELRAAMGVAEGDTVLAKVTDGELRLYRRDQAIRALQKRAKQLVASGTLVSDELIRERRDEAASE